MKCHVKNCNENAISQLLFVGLPLPIKENRFCAKHGRKYQEGDRFLVDFVR